MQPVLETVDTSCVNNFLRQSLPLIHDTHTETVCSYGGAASLLEQLQRMAPQKVFLVCQLKEVFLVDFFTAS